MIDIAEVIKEEEQAALTIRGYAKNALKFLERNWIIGDTGDTGVYRCLRGWYISFYDPDNHSCYTVDLEPPPNAGEEWYMEEILCQLRRK